MPEYNRWNKWLLEQARSVDEVVYHRWMQGDTLRQIAEDLGVRRARIWQRITRYADRNGLERRKKKGKG